MAQAAATRTVAAVDLGAESGRVTAVDFDGSALALRIVNRFDNRPRMVDGILRWDLNALWRNIGAGLGELAGGTPISAVGVDTWGVDYGLLDASGAVLDDPVCYRDDRGARALQRALGTVGAQRLYDETGVQILSINGLFGMLADVTELPERLPAANTLVMMPDVFHHLLSGSRVSEYTAVSTSGAYNMAENRWATELLDDLGIPTHMLPEVVPPGTDVGALLPELAGGALAGARVILPPGHDTASAVVATPFRDRGAVFISSGTWSLVGIETPAAVINEATRLANLTNEGGYRGSIRLLRNVMGLWILQQCRATWRAEGIELDYQQIADLAAGEPPLRSLIDPDHPMFLAPGDMPGRIRRFCAETGQPVPTSVGEVARCVVDSLALGYRAVVDDLIAVTGQRPPSISVVGGGSRHALLAQLTADATGLPVHCGPVEATALGNAAVQLATLGELAGPDEIRAAIAAGTEMTSYQPRPGAEIADAAQRFASLRAAGAGQESASTATKSRQ
ncbi:rhamnulokinase [Nakamurella aerolata]|uniref:Rhamnulokinase n=1 Tax=Nakamurella aerolata TaxID=1656892 RepID=A0A849ABL9_9ACTN|nr:rhamnulokinase family protein [Nakamurella aerolata]NNG36986.1 rhamnulokinase [Nakamurella aerolata]